MYLKWYVEMENLSRIPENCQNAVFSKCSPKHVILCPPFHATYISQMTELPKTFRQLRQ